MEETRRCAVGALLRRVSDLILERRIASEGLERGFAVEGMVRVVRRRRRVGRRWDVGRCMLFCW